MMEPKLKFFGHLNSAESQAEAALLEIKKLWEDGSVRLRPDELEQMNGTIGRTKKILNQVADYNHSRFGKILNEVIENDEEKRK